MKLRLIGTLAASTVSPFGPHQAFSIETSQTGLKKILSLAFQLRRPPSPVSGGSIPPEVGVEVSVIEGMGVALATDVAFGVEDAASSVQLAAIWSRMAFSPSLVV